MSIVAIYKLTSPTCKIYIGQTWNLKDRMRHYKKMSCKKQPLLFNSLKKHGFDNHKLDILHELPIDVTQDVLDRYEQLYMDAYRDAGFVLFNLKEAGNNGRHSDESKKKMSATIKTDRQREVARQNIAIANRMPRTEKQKEAARQSISKLFKRPRSEKQKAQFEIVCRSKRTEKQLESARKSMRELQARNHNLKQVG